MFVGEKMEDAPVTIVFWIRINPCLEMAFSCLVI